MDQSDINQRIEKCLKRKVIWFTKHMPPFPPPWATNTLRNILKQLREVRSLDAR